MVGGSYRLEVRKGLVYPHQALLNGIQINTSPYDVVKVDMAPENAKNMKLEVTPNDTMLTLRDAITRRVQWKRTSIDVALSVGASASTTAGQSHTTPGSIFLEIQHD
jgi:hypothetical protein